MFLPMTVGQLSFGQAGFMSIGAYSSVVLTLYAGRVVSHRAPRRRTHERAWWASWWACPCCGFAACSSPW